MKAYRCSACHSWVPDFRAYRYGGVIYCDEDLPPEGWEERLNGVQRSAP